MLLDTSGLLSLYDRRDLHHARAVSHYAGARRRVTHNYVLAEFVPLATVRGMPRHDVLEFIRDLTSDPDVELYWIDETLHRAAMMLLAKRSDKTYSVCDAASFLLMEQEGVSEALTTDRHFEQEGFVRLLK